LQTDIRSKETFRNLLTKNSVMASIEFDYSLFLKKRELWSTHKRSEILHHGRQILKDFFNKTDFPLWRSLGWAKIRGPGEV
jgi:hypothetical protein